VGPVVDSCEPTYVPLGYIKLTNFWTELLASKEGPYSIEHVKWKEQEAEKN
jgi:hypothetical protein